ncbi:probable phosphoglycerate mutase [Jatrophihabitans endophyticus]|uniref:Probable phosphoglycerate mutase n=1 Tax=Jatrophihabitans endophyticus TaxID=1206085 RepID=A0A1M5KTG4_9ACTN|nr:bifunctional RNase H/acid phosphatase [Jatrophihabitans endophyticus]SHG56035.1 probable phosphoglycerate mutase [Jatrophihabitans endophyticus]
MSAGGVEHVIVEADGGSRGNPGPAGYGAVVFDAASRAVLAEESDAIGVDTNNVAEYRGLIAGLQAAHALGAHRVDVRMDSKLVVEQMSGRWSVKNAVLQGLSREAQALRRGFDEVTFGWIPREKNKHADRLANEAMDRAAGRTPKPARTPVVAAPAWVPPAGPPTRLVLVRHGSTVHSADKRFSGRNDLPLNDAGRRQAAALAGRRYGQVAAVVSSPLRRAVETAEAVAGPLGLAVRIVDDLVETDFGAWEGLTFAEARELDPAALDAWRASPDAAPPGGESFAAVARRVRRAREEVIGAHPGGTVVVVSHVTPIKTLVRLALDAPPAAMFRLHLDTASVSTVDYWDDGNSSVRLVNDTAHLHPDGV